MHEIALVNAAAQAFIAEVDGGSVSSVTMAIGPKVERDVASSAWETAVSGTTVAGATLQFVDVFDELQCLDCQHEFPGDRLTLCPKCGGTGLVVGEAEEVSIAAWKA